MAEEITPELLLHAYAIGVFPMAETRDDPEIFWVDPKKRGILPLDGFHMSRSLSRAMRKTGWHIRVDHDFAGVIAACADRAEPWINDEIRALYVELHRRGTAHSVEFWDGDEMVGGVYGVTRGAAFFGESMFSRRTDASKMALAACVDRLRRGGFQLFDTQFITDHLQSLGAEEITRKDYHARLRKAVLTDADFKGPAAVTLQELAQRNTQTS